MPSTIRVLVVDDSALIRQMLTRALAMDPRVEVVGTAKTGVEAVEKSRELQPDVVTLDIEMPEMTGLEALPHIRKHTTARIVMLSAVDDPDTTYRALSMGAVDFIPKPASGVAGSITELSEVLIKKIKTANRITAEHAARVHEQMAPVGGDQRSDTEADAPTGPLVACVAIASSTGGPPALERVFAGLSGSMPAAYIIVQHLPAGFSASLARRLEAAGEIPVAEARDGDVIEPGRAYIAPHGWHAAVEKSAGAFRIRLTEDAPLHGVRPAADVLLKSVADVFGDAGVGVVLTGMGADGASGAREIRLAGGDTIVQDENTSVVWGMPGAAVRLGAASRVVPVGLVAAEIRRAVRSRMPGDGGSV